MDILFPTSPPLLYHRKKESYIHQIVAPCDNLDQASDTLLPQFYIIIISSLVSNTDPVLAGAPLRRQALTNLLT